MELERGRVFDGRVLGRNDDIARRAGAKNARLWTNL